MLTYDMMIFMIGYHGRREGGAEDIAWNLLIEQVVGKGVNLSGV